MEYLAYSLFVIVPVIITVHLLVAYVPAVRRWWDRMRGK